MIASLHELPLNVMSITGIIRRICELQPKWSSKNTVEMQERGVLVRKNLVESIRKHEKVLRDALGIYGNDMHIHGRDGSGRKTEAPWVRICSRTMSPRATEGFYLVIHFSADGSSVFVTIGHGSNNWHPDGSLVPFKPEKLAEIIRIGRGILNKRYGSSAPFVDEIRLGATKAGPENFERATVCAKRLSIQELSDDVFIEYVIHALKMLSVIYEYRSLGFGQDAATLCESDVMLVINPLRQAKFGQGFGASAADRKAVEMRAMDMTERWLGALNFTEIKDCSGSQSYDFSACRDSKVWKIEVKGTTAESGDAILMTANEVELHRAECGSTVLVIVFGIRLDRSGAEPVASGGTVWAEIGWDIDKWTQTPTAFRVSR